MYRLKAMLQMPLKTKYRLNPCKIHDLPKQIYLPLRLMQKALLEFRIWILKKSTDIKQFVRAMEATPRKLHRKTNYQ